MGKTKLVGTRDLVDPKTNEHIVLSMMDIDVEGRRGFYIAYMYNVLKLLDVIGNKKCKIVDFIINNMNSDNILIMTTREISSATQISTKTVTDTLRILEENDLIVRKVGCIMLNPKLFNNKSSQKENYLVLRYKEIQADNYLKKENKLNSQIQNDENSYHQMTLDEFI